MFYSHEILTSREGGVATVWLVATLGSKSNLKKVNRKAILDVDVPKTCEIIITPEAPMALRLQSNLLYGVSRVYSQQCGYVLSDAQLAQSNMRTLLKVVRTAELDPDAGKARPDQLVLADDPAFLPDLPGLDIDLSALDISSDGSSRYSSILSPHTLRSSLSGHQSQEESILSLIIPSSATGGAGDFGGFDVPSDRQASARPSSRLRNLLEDEEEGLDFDPGFTIDADGNVVITGQDQPQVTPAAAGARIGSESAVSARVRQELEEGRQAAQLDLAGAMDLNLDLPPLGDDMLILPDAEAFPKMVPRVPADAGFLRSSSAVPEEEESSESVEAPQRRRKPHQPRILPTDMTQELRNADLAQWNNNYIANMTNAAHSKFQHKAQALSKKNAAFWVYGAGIGGIGSGTGSSNLTNPLDMFAGDQLLQALTGVEASIAGRKRSRTEEGEHGSDTSEQRRVRMRESDGEQIGRGQEIILDEDDAVGMMGDEGIELGRHAPAPLEDQSTQFPWNVTASAARSRQTSITHGQHGLPGSAGGFHSSVGGSLPGVPGSLDRRASRITSASPLVGHGLQRLSSLEIPAHDDDEELLGAAVVSSSHGGGEAFQLYGPVARVSTQTAAESQWIKAALDEESGNFLKYIKGGVVAKAPMEIEEEGGGGDELARPQPYVLFEELLLPEEHTPVVAAQGLLHVLALATRGLINVEQERGYGPIRLGVVAGV